MCDVGPVIIRPAGEVKRVSIREAIKIKSLICEISTDGEVSKILEECQKPYRSVFRQTRHYHRLESFRRVNRICFVAKTEILQAIGYDREFTIRDPEFEQICYKYNYNPSSLAGTLVKYKFMEIVGFRRNPNTKSKNSKFRVYRILPQQ